jgi:hypothetical protein
MKQSKPIVASSILSHSLLAVLILALTRLAARANEYISQAAEVRSYDC